MAVLMKGQVFKEKNGFIFKETSTGGIIHGSVNEMCKGGLHEDRRQVESNFRLGRF